MIQYFVDNKSIEQVKNVCESLNKTKELLKNGQYKDIKVYYNECKNLFDEIKTIAIELKDEKLANSQFVFREYFQLFYSLGKYFELLKDKEYKKSWNLLQDCFDIVKYVRRFCDNRYELDEIYDLLIQYEALYPYSVFASSEYIISKSHCSICGKSMQSLECTHIKGNLYWGEPAVEHIDKIEKMQAVAMVKHPEDKRCILEVSDDNRTEEEKFKMLNEYLALNQPFLQSFSIKSIKEMRTKEGVSKVGRNQLCPCGSDLKFKRCCGKDMYYEHIRHIVTPKEKINLVLF